MGHAWPADAVLRGGNNVGGLGFMGYWGYLGRLKVW